MTNQQPTQPSPYAEALARQAESSWSYLTQPSDGSYQRPPAKSTPEWDFRMSWGICMAFIGLCISVISGIAAASYDNGSWRQPNDYTAFYAWGGIGTFLVLLGVILIAGAQRIDR